MDVKRRAHLLLLNYFLIAELCPASHGNSLFLLLLLVMLLLIVSHLLSFRLRSVGRRDLEVAVVVVEKKRTEEEGLCAVSGQRHHRFSNLRIPRSDLGNRLSQFFFQADF
jgi:hypothetical protein